MVFFQSLLILVYLPVRSAIDKPNVVGLLAGLRNPIPIRVFKWAPCWFHSRPSSGLSCSRSCSNCSCSSGHNDITPTIIGGRKGFIRKCSTLLLIWVPLPLLRVSIAWISKHCTWVHITLTSIGVPLSYNLIL